MYVCICNAHGICLLAAADVRKCLVLWTETR